MTPLNNINLGRWTLQPGLTFDTFVEIMASYHRILRDDQDWISFAEQIKNSLLFTSPGCWVSFNEINPGVRASMHGGSWYNASPFIIGRCVKDLRDILIPRIMDFLNLRSLLAIVPAHAEEALRMLEKFGFETSGVVPDDSTWSGTPHDSIIMSLKKGG